MVEVSLEDMSSGYADIDALRLGRVFLPAERRGGVAGPSIVAVRGSTVEVLSHTTTMADVLDQPDVLEWARSHPGTALCSLSELLVWSAQRSGSTDTPTLLSPLDLQIIKACGVTFAASMIERVLEEKAQGHPAAAEKLRAALQSRFGDDLSTVEPGSEQAAAAKQTFVEHDAWSQYLEVGIGPDAEVFTKAPVLSSVGAGAHVGVRSDSSWNNPEPEVVLVVNSRNEPVGATLGNDVNLRDFEGRSALLLGKAKDNNASCAIGPFIRLFDDSFGIDQVLGSTVATSILGQDGYVLRHEYQVSDIARHPSDLVRQTGGASHQYPDGFALFLGTGFVPTDDRFEVGSGFTHAIGDVVVISNARLGTLWNTVDQSESLPPWTTGIRGFWRNLAAVSDI